MSDTDVVILEITGIGCRLYLFIDYSTGRHLYNKTLFDYDEMIAIRKVLLRKSLHMIDRQQLNEDDFHQFMEDIAECKYFTKGCICSCNFNKCPYAYNDRSRKMNSKKAVQECKNYISYIKSPIELSDEEYLKYLSMNVEQREGYEKIKSMYDKDSSKGGKQ